MYDQIIKAEDILKGKQSFLTKEYINELKNEGENALSNLCEEYSTSGDLVFILKNLGRIPSTFGADWLVRLLNNTNDDVRLWVIKTIGKLNSEKYLEVLYKTANEDSSTIVKREAVSSIGRMRSKMSIPLLKSILTNEDPKIICQAIRGLLHFKGNNGVDEILMDMVNHENETIRTVIYKEYYSQNNRRNNRFPHTHIHEFLTNTVVNGDVRDVLNLVPEDSIHLTFTSPPYYNARDYSIYPSYDAYLKFLEEVFLETLRVTKEGRFLIVNTSPVIVPRISRSHSSKRYPIPFDLHNLLSKMGWEFIDDIVWMKPEYSVKNRVGGFQQHRKPLAYKPNSVTEYLMVYRKQTDKLIDWNIRQYDLNTVMSSKVVDGFETTNVWQINPKSDKIHSAIFPVDLCKRVVQYYSFRGDLIFDPFGGSGTLGRTAKSLGRKFFLTEKEPKYFDYMQTYKSPNLSLRNDNETKFITYEDFKKLIL